ncbi:hypothetical protein FOMPIDRAFT_1115157 [Fomitopsis schrenkii]|uniref:F-box domain-containing protein n=1 Tax=Fomitopsis schrenkii TaxID=2126942 RepID=S8FS68_FOMSC|nr:hypothetical protein FOMPIDRAFT_1115157 [Fomitopsis schrenkii]
MVICPALRTGEELRVEKLGSIRSFHYQMYHPRMPRSYPSEIVALTTVLEKVCDTLETLALMSESAPLSVMEGLHWPRLRKMVFYGSPLVGPFIRACFGMQRLRYLSVKISPAWSTMPQPIWPAGFDGAFPWPELERLTVSYPDPQDEIYDHLPSTLRSLSLRCWPHQHYQTYLAEDVGMIGYPDTDHLLSPSVLLLLLHRCSMLTLDHLEIEYAADEQDDALLQYVAATFPHLVGLIIHCYRTNLSRILREDVPVASNPTPLSYVCSHPLIDLP